jgi:uncharacterized membrane protein
MNPLNWPEHVRAYYYRIATTIILVLGTMGVVTEGDGGKILTVIAAVLGLSSGGLAAKNTSRTA